MRAAKKRQVFGMIRVAAATGLVLGLAGTVLAAGGDGHGADSGVLLKDFLYRCLNFAIVFGALAFLLAKPLRQGLADRRAKLVEALDKANKAKETAEAKLAEYERKLGDSDREMAELLAQAREENSRERDRVLADARALAESVRKEARQSADREIERARRELRTEASKMAVSMAEQMLRKGVTVEDRGRLVKENLQQMESQS